MTDDTRAAAARYFTSWKNGDFDALRALLADDVDFAGPMAQIVGADECVEGLRGMAKIMTNIEIKKVFVDGADVITWFDLHTSATEAPLPTANWSHVENGKITRIRVAFDPRPLVG
jgi:ketosteroid isomerase-like protein